MSVSVCDHQGCHNANAHAGSRSQNYSPVVVFQAMHKGSTARRGWWLFDVIKLPEEPKGSTRNGTARTDLVLSAKRSCSLRWGDRGDRGDRGDSSDGGGKAADWQTCSLPHRCSCFLLPRLRLIPLSPPPVLLPRWPLFLQSSRIRRAVAERLAWIGRNGKTSGGEAIQRVK